MNFTDPTGHRECLNSGANGSTDVAPHGAYAPAQTLSDVVSPEPILQGVPIQEPEWTNGFGPNSFAITHPDFYIDQSAGIHPGMDFGKKYDPNCISCMTVYATVSGTISEEYGGDADPNVVIDLGNGMFVIYGHVEGSLLPETKVQVGDAIGFLENQSGVDANGNPYDNTHVHLSLRQGTRTYNPIYFFSDPSVLANFTFRYPKGESLYSVSSYEYGSGASYWNPVADPWNAAGITRW